MVVVAIAIAPVVVMMMMMMVAVVAAMVVDVAAAAAAIARVVQCQIAAPGCLAIVLREAHSVEYSDRANIGRSG